MNKRYILNMISPALIFASSHGAEAQTQTQTPNTSVAGQNLEGTWEGAPDVGAMKLRLALKVTAPPRRGCAKNSTSRWPA
jgi:hypothetical protein